LHILILLGKVVCFKNEIENCFGISGLKIGHAFIDENGGGRGEAAKAAPEK